MNGGIFLLVLTTVVIYLSVWFVCLLFTAAATCASRNGVRGTEREVGEKKSRKRNVRERRAQCRQEEEEEEESRRSGTPLRPVVEVFGILSAWRPNFHPRGC